MKLIRKNYLAIIQLIKRQNPNYSHLGINPTSDRFRILSYKETIVIKAENGLTNQEMYWAYAAISTTISAVIYTFWFKCPMPLVLSFAFNAVTVAQFEPEDA